MALVTSGANTDWPDTFDIVTGTVTYYGDNRKPGPDLHDTPKGGNIVLRNTFYSERLLQRSSLDVRPVSYQLACQRPSENPGRRPQLPG
jgi:hypothetical protein